MRCAEKIYRRIGNWQFLKSHRTVNQCVNSSYEFFWGPEPTVSRKATGWLTAEAWGRGKTLVGDGLRGIRRSNCGMGFGRSRRNRSDSSPQGCCRYEVASGGEIDGLVNRSRRQHIFCGHILRLRQVGNRVATIAIVQNRSMSNHYVRCYPNPFAD